MNRINVAILRRGCGKNRKDNVVNRRRWIIYGDMYDKEWLEPKRIGTGTTIIPITISKQTEIIK